MARKTEVRYIQYYTDGSAARQLEIRAPRKKKPAMPKVRRQKKRVIYLDPLAVGGIFVSVVMLVLMAVGSVQLYTARQQAAQMERYVAVLTEQNRVLSDTYESGYDLETVEEVALALGMIPVDQAQTITIRVPETEAAEPESSTWENFWAFLTGIFA